MKESKEMYKKQLNSESTNRLFIGLVGSIFAVLCMLVWVTPDSEYSKTERRLLKQMPELTMDLVTSGRFMNAFEEYTLDQFPYRDRFRSLKAATSLKLDNNGIYVVEDVVDEGTNVESDNLTDTITKDEANVGITQKDYDVLADMEYPLNENSLEYASKRFQNIYDMYLKDSDCQVYLSVIPDKNYFYGKENGYLTMDYEQLVNIMLNDCSYMTYLDIFPYLSGEDYYRTDIHWRQENLADVADVLLSGMENETGNVETKYQTMTVEGQFYGVYHGQAALPIEPDNLQYFTNDTIKQMKVFDYQNSKEIPVYDTEKIKSDDPYEMYVGGPISLATIDNPACNNGKHLILFRDSFGSSIAPLLAQGYEKTTLIDIRYILPSVLEQYVDFQNADVLFLYSTPVLNHSDVLK